MRLARLRPWSSHQNWLRTEQCGRRSWRGFQKLTQANCALCHPEAGFHWIAIQYLPPRLLLSRADKSVNQRALSSLGKANHIGMIVNVRVDETQHF